MSTIMEVQGMFTRLRDELGNEFEQKQAKFGAGEEDKAKDAAQLWLFTQMGLFAAESLIVDIKRIANALDGGNPTVRQGTIDSLYDLANPRG
jgi:hypothetical protein